MKNPDMEAVAGPVMAGYYYRPLRILMTSVNMLRKTLFLLLGFSLFSAAAHAEKTIQLLANTSPPYADARLEQQGLALELVKHVFSRTEYSPKIKIETWGRAMEGVKIGVYDALATAWYSDCLLYTSPSPRDS